MDIIDRAQQRQQEDIDHALASRHHAGIGIAHCINADCGEPIADYRQQLGARLCLDCQRREERATVQCSRTAV
jgi:RNA polymerase-binding transcription factor DksA